MTKTKRSYRATFILDNRGKEDSIDQIVEGVKKEITAVQGDVIKVETIGRKDFARTPDAKFTAGTYVQIDFSSPAEGPSQLKERLRLNTNVARTLIESA